MSGSGGLRAVSYNGPEQVRLNPCENLAKECGVGMIGTKRFVANRVSAPIESMRAAEVAFRL